MLSRKDIIKLSGMALGNGSKFVFCQKLNFTVMVQLNFITGHPNHVKRSLQTSIGLYLHNNLDCKIGITGRDPSKRFLEHLRIRKWERMVVIYVSESANYINKIENLLIERFAKHLVNEKPGGGSNVAENGKKYVYILLSN